MVLTCFVIGQTTTNVQTVRDYYQVNDCLCFTGTNSIYYKPYAISTSRLLEIYRMVGQSDLWRLFCGSI